MGNCCIPVMTLLKKKKIVEGINFCPYCKEPYIDKNIPPACDKCKHILIPEVISFRNGRDYPRYFIRIVKDKKEFVRDFIRFFAEFHKWLE